MVIKDHRRQFSFYGFLMFVCVWADYKEIQGGDGHFSGEINGAQNQINE